MKVKPPSNSLYERKGTDIHKGETLVVDLLMIRNLPRQ